MKVLYLLGRREPSLVGGEGVLRLADSLSSEEDVEVWLDIIMVVFGPFQGETGLMPQVTIRLMGMLSGSVQVASLALNAIFDIFSEDTYDHTFIQSQCLPQLTSFSHSYKHLIKKTPNKHNRHYYQETMLNLSRFI
jgi:hypothetical protein